MTLINGCEGLIHLAVFSMNSGVFSKMYSALSVLHVAHHMAEFTVCVLSFLNIFRPGVTQLRWNLLAFLKEALRKFVFDHSFDFLVQDGEEMLSMRVDNLMNHPRVYFGAALHPNCHDLGSNDIAHIRTVYVLIFCLIMISVALAVGLGRDLDLWSFLVKLSFQHTALECCCVSQAFDFGRRLSYLAFLFCASRFEQWKIVR